MAGGFTCYADERKVQIRRVKNGAPDIQEVNAKEISTDKKAQDFEILSGDVVFVKERII